MAEGAGGSPEDTALWAALVDLEKGRPERARRLALTVLHAAPRSRLGLFAWADAADAMGLHEEAESALVRLADLVPQRAELWWRLCLTRQKLGRIDRVSAERALRAAEPRDASLAAAQWLFREALDSHDFPRAEQFVQYLSLGFEALENTHLDLAELELERGRFEAARSCLRAGPEPAVLDARGWLTVARAAVDPHEALRPLSRAVLLGSPPVAHRAAEVVCVEPRLAPQILPLARAMGWGEAPGWKLAAALHHAGSTAPGSICAEQVKRTPQPSLALIWLRLALSAAPPEQVVQPESLRRAADFASTYAVLASHPLKLEADRLLECLTRATVSGRLAALHGEFHFAQAWADSERELAYQHWLDQGQWEELLGDLARGLPAGSEAELDRALAGLRQVERGALAVALVGEFNAGKSSLVNALVGEPGAAVGVTPTTVAADSYDWRGLTLLDTPGFNAPFELKGNGTLEALEYAHLALWVVDGALPFRDSEARRLKAMQRRKIPFWIVVNKRDRISESELNEVLAHVGTGLKEAGIEPVRSPLAVSALRPESLGSFAEQFAGWSKAHEKVLRRRACLRVVRGLLDQVLVPSSAERKATEAPSGPGGPGGPARAALDFMPWRALARALERAENIPKR